MTYDREDYQALVAEKQKEKLNGQRQSLEYLRQAAIKQDLLTGDAHWDTFLSYLEAAKQEFARDLDVAKAALCDPLLVDPNEIMGLKMKVAQLGAQIATVDAVLTLPKDLKEQGERAKDLLKRLDG